MQPIAEFFSGRNYINEFKKFITGQYLTKGLRITFGALLPAIILYKYNLLNTAIALPLGALMVSLADSPGPIHHRRNGMLISNGINFLVAVIIGFTRHYPWLLAIELTVLSFFLSLVSVYGNRASAIGLIAMIVMVISIDVHAEERILQDALFMLGGGIWYMLLSLLLYSLRPYKLIQQALGECIITTGAYIKVKARLYEKDVRYSDVYDELLPIQVAIHSQQEQLREMLFRARGFTRESTAKGRILLMMFLDSVDLFEHVMTSQQSHALLHEDFGGGELLERFRLLIIETGNELEKIGLVVQSGFPLSRKSELDDLIRETEAFFVAYHDNHISQGNIEGFISLRHVLNSIKEIAHRLKKLYRYSTYSREVSSELKSEPDVSGFVSRQELDFKLMMENITLDSNVFRHSLRVSLCILTGYLIAQLFPFGHSYWILLTVVTILKPAYSISKQRNTQRLTGTLIGVGVGFLLLYFFHAESVLFACMAISMIIGYSFLQIRYMISVAGITLYVLISFHFFHTEDFRGLAQDRIIDTVIGSALAFISTILFLPKWEYEQIDEPLKKLMTANLNYFRVVARAFYGAAADTMEYKSLRKNTYVALANLSDAFQRLLSEPKNKTPHPELLHQLVVSNHMLSSHIASLGVYSQLLAPAYHFPAFKPAANAVENKMQAAIDILSGRICEASGNPDEHFATMRDRVQDLLNQRLDEISLGVEKSDVRKKLSGFKTITDQFEIINTITADITNILRKMKPV
ncbi:MAG: FUSC family protein [Chitinophagaceae bacterium]|nr:FUSC family protein [Chitinophagaceae bacterium]MCW5929613.1 FUSC family protein [Chitinophagaceae bacterium]